MLRISCSRNPENIRNPPIFLRKMGAFRCFTLHKGHINFHASMKFLTFCRLSHYIRVQLKSKALSHVSQGKQLQLSQLNCNRHPAIENPLRWAGCPQALCFHTVCAVNAQTWLNCNGKHRNSCPDSIFLCIFAATNRKWEQERSPV